MTTTDGFDWPQNDPLFALSMVLISEGIGGNGVLAQGDMSVTATANANEIQVAAGDLFYGGTLYSLGAAETHTLSSNSSGSDRWDLVYFDTGTGASAVREGTAASNPEPPSLQSGEFGLAYIYVADGESDVTDSEIKNWRTHAPRADQTYVADSPSLYAGDTVESALTSELQQAAQIGAYPLASADLASGSVTSSEIATDAVTSSELATDAAGVDEVNVPEVLVDAPNGNIQAALLEDTESTEIAVPVPDTETLKVYRWGVYKISDGTAPTGLEARLLDGSDTVQASENTVNTEDATTPVASYQNSSGSLSIFKLRAYNGTGNAYTTDGVGAVFSYVVE